MSAEGHHKTYIPSHPLSWFPQFLQLSRNRFRAQGHLLGAAILVGIVAGLGAIVFSVACNVAAHYCMGSLIGFHEAIPPANDERVNEQIGWLLQWLPAGPADPVPWLLLLVPTLGGIISGFIVFRFAPEAEGHGTDSAIAAYHYHQGFIRPRVPLVKIVASAITIGSGGSGGREGPIAQVGAGFGSILGRLLKMRPAERRILMEAGVGAGIAAIFRAPLAGALFAAEVLYRKPEFESEVIIPAGMASVVSYCTFGMFFGWRPLFDTPPLAFDNAWRLVPYLGLAVAMALLAMVYTRTFYGVTYLFKKLPISNYFKPAAGAFLTGVVGASLYLGWKWTTGEEQPSLLAVMSFGYGILQQGLSLVDPSSPPQHLLYADAATLHRNLYIYQIPWEVLLAVALSKILTTSLTIGSGGSGGVFGPSMVIGGCAGGALGLLFDQFWPGLINPASFMIVGMAGFFAAAGKVPFSTIMMVSEMTGNYHLLLPALWVCTLSYLLSDEQSLYQSQVEGRSMSPAHKGQYVREVLAGLLVSQFFKPDSVRYLIRPEDTLSTIIDRLAQSPYSVLPVVDKEQRLQGVVVLEEVHLASQSPFSSPWLLAADLMRTRVQPLRPTNTLDQAQEIFVQNDLFALPVVDDSNKVVGIAKRSEIARIYLRHVHGTPAEDQVLAAPEAEGFSS